MAGRGTWGVGSTTRWRRLRAIVLARDRQPDGGWRCARCGRWVHHLRHCPNRPHGCTADLHVHHVDGTRGRPPDQVRSDRLAILCAGCNYVVGDPATSGHTLPDTTPPPPNPMVGVPHR